MKRGPFIVERLAFDDMGAAGRVEVRVREYPAGAALEFDLSPEEKEAVLGIVLRAHAARLDALNLKAMEGAADG